VRPASWWFNPGRIAPTILWVFDVVHRAPSR
jgi:hypothetical protein